MSQKLAVCGPFFRSLGNVGDWPTGWLTFQVSNSHIPDRNMRGRQQDVAGFLDLANVLKIEPPILLR
jgi:hypothetical protein